MILKINPYKMGSASARTLAQSLDVKRIRTRFLRKQHHVLLNWGIGHNRLNPFRQGVDLNHPDAVRVAANKLSTLMALDTINDLQYTRDINDAREWVQESKVYCRTVLHGSSGDGIVVASNADELTHALLYTKAAHHDNEYRIHVFKDRIIHVQEKRRRNGITPHDVRNHDNGYVFCQHDVNVPQIVLDKCLESVRLLGLDLGAVDVGYKLNIQDENEKVFIFEVNTAPGLEGTSIQRYTEAIANYMENL